MKQDVISLTRLQLNRLDIINKAIAGFLTVPEAATALGLSERQIQRIKKEVSKSGPAGIIHKNSLKVPSNALPNEISERIISLKKTYALESANFKHFGEILSEYHDIDISYSTLHGILSEAGIKSPMTRRRFKPHRRRKRRPQAGLLLQVDASPFAWFKGNSKRYSLHGAIDDATNQITGLYLCKNECLMGYFNMLERTISNYGIPVSLYADRHTIFQSPNKDKAVWDSSLTINDTQLGRCLKELSIQLIPARSPQAKGRIERLWGTLQSRLPVEFAIRNITTIDAANEFLATYIYSFNSEFAVEPVDTDSMFLKPDIDVNLDYILCIKDFRSVDSGGVFSFNNKSFKVNEGPYSALIPQNAKCQVLSSPKFGIKLQYRKIVFDVSRYIPEKRKAAETKTQSTYHKVPDSNYYKYGQSLTPKLFYDETDSEIIFMLEELFLKKQA